MLPQVIKTTFNSMNNTRKWSAVSIYVDGSGVNTIINGVKHKWNSAPYLNS